MYIIRHSIEKTENGGAFRMKMKLSLRLIYLGLLVLFILCFALASGMAYYTPYSGRAYVEYGVAPVSGKVAGTIEEVLCHDGERVEKGAPLFRLDDRNFRAEVSRLEALYETTANRLEALDLQIREAEEKIRRQEKTVEKCRIDFERDRTLVAKKAISPKAFEESQLSYDVAAAELSAMKRGAEAQKRERGAAGAANSELRGLEAELNVARNQLEDTVIRAPISGLLSCHQLYRGQMVQLNEHYAIIQETENLAVNADLMEKSVRNLHRGQQALVAFDAIPGRVFRMRVDGVVRELRSGYVAPTELHQIEEDTRWIRTVGRTRVRFVPAEPLPENAFLSSGSKAAVALENNSHRILSSLSSAWIRLISGFNFVY